MPVKRWIKRKDGIVQRYVIKNLKAFKEKYVYNRKERVWEPKPPVPVPVPEVEKKPETMFRLTICFNFVVHHNYYAFRFQVWAKTREELEEKKEEYVRMAMEMAVKTLGWKYSYGELWFKEGAQLGIGIQEVPYDEDLIGERQAECEYLGHKKEGWNTERARRWIKENLWRWLE